MNYKHFMTNLERIRDVLLKNNVASRQKNFPDIEHYLSECLNQIVHPEFNSHIGYLRTACQDLCDDFKVSRFGTNALIIVVDYHITCLKDIASGNLELSA